jgi:pilus assembly protein CpaB
MRRTLLAITAVLLATMGTALLYLYVASADTRARLSIRTVKVLVAQRDARPGTAATQLAVTAKDIPAFGAAPQALTSLTSVRGRVLRVQVFAGQQLSTRMFDVRTASGLAPGHRGISVAIQEANRVPSLLKAGSPVDIFVIRRNALALVLRQATVLDVGTRGIVTCDLTEADAQKVLAASVTGQLVLEIVAE